MSEKKPKRSVAPKTLPKAKPQPRVRVQRTPRVTRTTQRRIALVEQIRGLGYGPKYARMNHPAVYGGKRHAPTLGRTPVA